MIDSSICALRLKNNMFFRSVVHDISVLVQDFGRYYLEFSIQKYCATDVKELDLLSLIPGFPIASFLFSTFMVRILFTLAHVPTLGGQGFINPVGLRQGNKLPPLTANVYNGSLEGNVTSHSAFRSICRARMRLLCGARLNMSISKGPHSATQPAITIPSVKR